MTTEINKADLFFTMPDGRKLCDEGLCVAFLLANEVLLVGTSRSCFFEDPIPQATLWVFCSDMFAYAADAEPLPGGEIGALTEAYLENDWEGVIRWVALRRKERPLPSIIERLKKKGVWDEALEVLPST